LLPESDEEKPKETEKKEPAKNGEPKTVVIDEDGLANRILAVDIPARIISGW
jgi:tricorn protease